MLTAAQSRRSTTRTGGCGDLGPQPGVLGHVPGGLFGQPPQVGDDPGGLS